MRVRDITTSIRWTDQTYARDHSVTPVLSFARPARWKRPYTEKALAKLDCARDCIAQYVPKGSPYPEMREWRGAICSLVFVYPLRSDTEWLVTADAYARYNLERWPDAIMVREAYHLARPAVALDTICPTVDELRRLTSGGRNRLAEAGEWLWDALKDEEIVPVPNLYRSPSALDFLERCGQDQGRRH